MTAVSGGRRTLVPVAQYAPHPNDTTDETTIVGRYSDDESPKQNHHQLSYLLQVDLVSSGESAANVIRE